MTRTVCKDHVEVGNFEVTQFAQFVSEGHEKHREGGQAYTD